MLRAKFWIVVSLGACLGCTPDAEQAAEPRVRTIAAFTVETGAAGQVRSLSGTVQAVQSASLSFAVSGTISEIAVSVGQSVRAGDIIARLDTEPYDLNVASARAQLQSAQASEVRARDDLQRQRKLFEGGWVSPAAVSQYELAYTVAANDVEAAEAQLSQAQRSLDRSRIVAPYDGTIADVLVDPFAEISAGRPAVEINGEGALEMAIDAPDRLAEQIRLGLDAAIDATSVAGCGCRGRVSSIGKVVGGGTTFPVTVAILDPPPELLPGMSATATFEFATGLDGALVPFGAIAAGPDANTAYVFKYDAETRAVHRTPVVVAGGQDERVLVVEGLAEGDVIAAGGTGLLRDGQIVRLPEGEAK